MAGSKQPYHAAAAPGCSDPASLIRELHRRSEDLATRAISNLVDEIRNDGSAVVAAGIIFASGRPLPELAMILRSHPLLHTAEGEFFRLVLVSACEHCGIAVIRVKEREIWEKASGVLGCSVGDLERCLNGLSKSLGPPWTRDEKLASLAAWIAM